MKRKGSAFKLERPQRAVISEKEALKRMKEFSKRKEQFLATARTGKSSVLACIVFVIFAMPAYSQSLSPGAHDFSGKYSSWWQFGGGSITLEADGTFRNDSGSCTFTTQESGTYIFSQGTLHFKILKYTGKQNGDGKEVDLSDPKSRREFFHYADDDKVESLNTEFILYPVKWGERRYLIYESDLGDFTNAINLGIEPRDAGSQINYYGSFYLREGDEQKNPSGKPTLPSKYLVLLLNKPITATIISVQPKANGKEKEQIAIIDQGRLAGVKVGIKFITPEQEPAFWSNEGIVLSVEDTSAKVEVYDRLVGEVLTTKFVRKDRFQ